MVETHMQQLLGSVTLDLSSAIHYIGLSLSLFLTLCLNCSCFSHQVILSYTCISIFTLLSLTCLALPWPSPLPCMLQQLHILSVLLIWLHEILWKFFCISTTIIIWFDLEHSLDHIKLWVWIPLTQNSPLRYLSRFDCFASHLFNITLSILV